MYGNPPLGPGAMGPIANPIQALRTMFAITGEKAYPQSLADFIQPTVEVQELVLGPLWDDATVGSANLNATGFTSINAGAVPPGQGWIVKELCLNTPQVLVTEQIRLKPAVRINYGTGSSIRAYDCGASTSLTDAVGLGAAAGSRHFDQALWLPPGTDLGVWVDKITTAATILVNLSIRFFIVKL